MPTSVDACGLCITDAHALRRVLSIAGPHPRRPPSPASTLALAMSLQLCAVPAADLVHCVWCGTLCPRTDYGSHLCVKCSVYDSLQAEPMFEEDDLGTTTYASNEYGDSTYELPFTDASYCDEEEETGDTAAASTGGTLTEPRRRSPCSMFAKLKAILPQERQPVPVARIVSENN